MSCKGKIYPTLKSKLPVKSCPNKAKDEYGFCLQHRSQSKTYKRQIDVDAEMGLSPSILLYIKYNNEKTCIKMRMNQKIFHVLKDINEKYNTNNILMLDNQFIDMTLPAGFYENMILDLVPKPG